MRLTTAYRQIIEDRQNIAILTAVSAGFVLLTLLFSSIVIVKVNRNNKSFAGSSDASLSVAWSRPVGYVTFYGSSYSNNSVKVTKKCLSTGLSCSIPAYTFKPGAAILYNVRVNGYETDKPVILSGSTDAVLCYCTKAGSVSVSWSWTYAVAVFPNLYLDCLAAGTANCKTASGYTTNSWTATGLWPATLYRKIVCAPDCSKANSKIYDQTASTDILASPGCFFYPDKILAGGSFKLTTTGGVGGDVYIMGLYLLGADKAKIDTIGVNAKDVPIAVPGMLGGGVYVIRVGGVACSSAITSGGNLAVDSVPLTTYDLLLCSSSDVNRDGYINSSDMLLISKNYGTSIAYDVDRSGAVNTIDLGIVAHYYGQACAKPMGMTVTPAASCSDVPYTVAFGWQGKGYAWSLDVSTDPTFPAGYSSRSINNLSGLFAPSGFDPAIQFNPGPNYYWRISNGSKVFYPVSPNNTFLIKNCSSGGGTSHSQSDIKNYLHNNTKFAQIVISADCNGRTRGDCANGPSERLGKILYGVAGPESGWSEKRISDLPTCSGDLCYGLLQFNKTTFGNYAKEISVTTGKTYSWDNAYDQLEIAYYLMMKDPTASGYQMSTQWYADSVGTPFLWQQYSADY